MCIRLERISLCKLEARLATGNIIIILISPCPVVEGKRASGLTAIWLARNRFAVLDKSHQVNVPVERKRMYGGGGGGEHNTLISKGV